MNDRFHGRGPADEPKQNSASISTRKGPSPFLRLPGELRNEIYKLALHEDEGLYYVNTSLDKPILAMQKASSEAYNQLKFVNRQLHSETAGLELRVNKIKFVPEREGGTAADQFLHFARILNPDKANSLTNIVLRGCVGASHPFPKSLDVMESINEFCETDPACRVSYIVLPR